VPFSVVPRMVHGVLKNRMVQERPVIPRSKETKPKLSYVCPGNYITRTMIHHDKTDAIFNYLNIVLFFLHQ
jgi:hypothetical protein